MNWHKHKFNKADENKITTAYGEVIENEQII